jgi:inhibitor of cysteine peptidase
MTQYYLEARSLLGDASLPGDDIPWIPVTLPVATPVQNGQLGVWDTDMTPNGLYELRLTVTLNNAPSMHYVVTPLRVANAAPAPVTPTPAPATPVATPVPVDNTPRVTATLDAHVRTGDDTTFAAIGWLPQGQTATVVGMSSTNSGWFIIQLPNGARGWISPTVVTPSGDFSAVPRVNPPPRPTPVPVPTNPPFASVTLNGISLNPTTPTCGTSFNVQVNVLNAGNAVSGATTVSVQDVHLASGTATASGSAGVPALNPGANFVAVVQLNVTAYYNEAHQIRAWVGGSQVTANYTLAQGNCGAQPPQPKTVQITESANGQTVTLNQGDVLMVTLASNPSTGFNWNLPPDPLSVLAKIGGPSFAADASLPGGGGRTSYAFKVVGAGQNVLRLVYQKPNEPPTNVFQVTIIGR